MTTITISKSEVFNEVEKRSSLEGLIQPEKFDLLWASSETSELLESYWVEGYTAIVQLLKRYLNGDTITYNLTTIDQDEVLNISVVMPDRYDTKLDGSVTNDAKMIIACNVLTGWLNVVSPGVAPKYDTEANGYAEDMRVKLLYRTNPVNKTSAAVVDGEDFAEAAALTAAKTDEEEFAEALALAEANVDTESFDEGNALSTAKADDDKFKTAHPIRRAKFDYEELKQYRKFCNVHLP